MLDVFYGDKFCNPFEKPAPKKQYQQYKTGIIIPR